MKTFEIVLEGWDYRTSNTDDLIKWVNAPNVELAKQYAINKGWNIESIYDLPYYSTQQSDGVDAVIWPDGSVAWEAGKQLGRLF